MRKSFLWTQPEETCSFQKPRMISGCARANLKYTLRPGLCSSNVVRVVHACEQDSSQEQCWPTLERSTPTLRPAHLSMVPCLELTGKGCIGDLLYISEFFARTKIIPETILKKPSKKCCNCSSSLEAWAQPAFLGYLIKVMSLH